ncbi:hypothetical protein [Paenibacillus turpanensis]|uniref:hypothetical protein n=1 Tax=Paenibacillus turpanensis TaxID=2689078 RepID=UPI001408B66E|nr:hypothetical protein [Paenibacillus turpanensis]
MSNRKRNLSGTGKELLDSLCVRAEVERPVALKIALAKGIALGRYELEPPKDDKPKWTIPDGLIKDREYLLFKHLIIQEQQKSLDEETVSDYVLAYIEAGLRALQKVTEEQTSLEDFRIKMLQ